MAFFFQHAAIVIRGRHRDVVAPRDSVKFSGPAGPGRIRGLHDESPGCPDGRSSAILPCWYFPDAMPISKLRHNRPLQSALESTLPLLSFRSVAVRPG